MHGQKHCPSLHDYHRQKSSVQESQVHSPMNLPGSKCTAAGVETGTAPGKAQDGPSGAKASQGARAAGAGANAAPVSSQKEARTPKVLYGHHASVFQVSDGKGARGMVEQQLT